MAEIIQCNIKGLKEFKAQQQAKLRKASRNKANTVDLMYVDDNNTMVTTNENQRKRRAQADAEEVDKLIQVVNNDLYVTGLDSIVEVTHSIQM